MKFRASHLPTKSARRCRLRPTSVAIITGLCLVVTGCVTVEIDHHDGGTSRFSTLPEFARRQLTEVRSQPEAVPTRQPIVIAKVSSSPNKAQEPITRSLTPPTRVESAIRQASLQLNLQVPPAQPEEPLSPLPGSQLAIEPARLPTAPSDDASASAIPSRDIDLTTALQLVGGQSPEVAFAQSRITEAAARLNAARAMWLPSLRAGVSYNRHTGNLQTSSGSIVKVDRTALQSGLGVSAVGAGSPAVPGLSAQFHLADALFEPQVAERTETARKYGASAALNNEMLAAALAYFELLQAMQQKTIAEETQANATALARLTSEFARTGEGNQADADRARTELAVRQNDVARADEAIAVASARLVEVLHLEAPLQVHPVEAGLTQIELVATETPLTELLSQGFHHRPELGENFQLVEAAQSQSDREVMSMLIPQVSVGLSYGGYGGGLGDNVSNFHDRVDFDAAAFWELRNLGIGDRSILAQAEARVDQARFREMRVRDRIAREITEAQAQVMSRRRQIETAGNAVKSAEESFKRNQNRIKEGQGLPLEALQSLQALDQARREYLDTLIGYNAAQFRLHRTIGWPTEIEG